MLYAYGEPQAATPHSSQQLLYRWGFVISDIVQCLARACTGSLALLLAIASSVLLVSYRPLADCALSLVLRGGRIRWLAEALTPYARRRALANCIAGLAATVLAI